MWNAYLDEAQAWIKISGRNINNLRYADDTTRKWRGTKEPLDESKRSESKSWLKTLHSKTKIMTSSPITSWQMDEVIVEAVTDFIFLGFKITADGDCSHEIKRCLLLGRKTMTNLDRILKSRDISLLTKVCIVKDMVFSSSHIWMWEMDHLASGYHDIEHFCCLRKSYWHHFREWSLAIQKNSPWRSFSNRTLNIGFT